MNREEDKKQLKPLTYGDALALPQSEKKLNSKKLAESLLVGLIIQASSLTTE